MIRTFLTYGQFYIVLSFLSAAAWKLKQKPSGPINVSEGGYVRLSCSAYFTDIGIRSTPSVQVRWTDVSRGNNLYKWNSTNRLSSRTQNPHYRFETKIISMDRIMTRMFIENVPYTRAGEYKFMCEIRKVPEINFKREQFRISVTPLPKTTPKSTTTIKPITTTQPTTTTLTTQTSTTISSTTTLRTSMSSTVRSTVSSTVKTTVRSTAKPTSKSTMETTTSKEIVSSTTETVNETSTTDGHNFRCLEAKKAGIDLCTKFAKCFDDGRTYRCQCADNYQGDGMVAGACEKVPKNYRRTWMCPIISTRSGCVAKALINMKKRFPDMSLAQQMQNVKSFSKTVTSGDELRVFSSVMDEMVQGFDEETDKHYKTMIKAPGAVAEAVVKTTSELIMKRSSWMDQSVATRRSLVTNFTRMLEKTCMATTRVDPNLRIDDPMIDVEVNSFRAGQEAVDFKPGGNEEVKLFTKSTFSYSPAATEKINPPRVVFVRYKGMNEYLSQNSKEMEDGKEKENATKLIVLSNIISATASKSDVVKKIRFRLSHDLESAHENASSMRKRCAYWNERSLSWAFDGCRMNSTTKEYSICECDHLTSFAILLDVSGSSSKFSEAHKLSLSIITYVGCILSIFCCIFGVWTYDILRRSKGDRMNSEGRTSFIIYEMICLSLLLAQTIFLMGIFHTQNSVICSIVAAALHYFFLLLFEWMLMAGVYYILVYTQPYSISTLDSHRCLVISGLFLIPAIIVGVSLGLRLDGYGTKTHCWLSVSDGLIWAFVGPVTVMLSVNMILLSILIVLTWRIKPNDMLETGEVNRGWVTSRARKLRYELLFCIVLGATWIFGYLLIENVTSLFFSYVFTILNSLQGVFILISYANWNRIRAAYIAEFRRKRWLPESFRRWLHSRQYSPGGPPGVGMVGSSGSATGSQRTRSARGSGSHRGLLSGTVNANTSVSSGALSHTTRTTRINSGSSGAKWSLSAPGMHGIIDPNDNSVAMVTETETGYNENYTGHSMMDEPRQVFPDFDERMLSNFVSQGDGDILNMTASMPLREHEEGGDHQPARYSSSSSVASSASTTSPSSSYSDDRNRPGAVVVDDLPPEPPTLPVVCSVPSPFAVHHSTALNGDCPEHKVSGSVTAPRMAKRRMYEDDDEEESDYLMPNMRAQRHTLDCRSRPRDDIDLRASVTAKQKRFSHSDLYANADDPVYYSEPPLEPSTLDRGAVGFSRVTDV